MHESEPGWELDRHHTRPSPSSSGRPGQPQPQQQELRVNINLQTLHGDPIGGKLPRSRRRIPSNRSARNKTNRWSNYQNCVELRNRDRSLGKHTYKLGPPQGGHIYAFGAVFRQPSCAKGPRYYNSCSATLHPMREI